MANLQNLFHHVMNLTLQKDLIIQNVPKKGEKI